MTTENNVTINEAINNTTETKGEHAMTQPMTPEAIEEIIEKSAKAVYDLTMEYDHNVAMYGCREFAKEAYRNKTILRCIMRNHPNWNEEKQQIALKRDVLREIDRNACSDFFYWVRDSVRRMVDKRTELAEQEQDKLIDKANSFTWHIMSNLSQYMENESVDFVNELFPELKIHYGAKTSRVVRKVLLQIYDLNNFEELTNEIVRNADGTPKRDIYGCVICEQKLTKQFNSKYAMFADAINPIKIKRWTILSINPLDFLTMSFGNSWSSCHTIDKNNKRHGGGEHYHGMYCGGTLSYALDEVSIIVYTVDDKYDPTSKKDVIWNGNWYGGFETQDKIHRQMIHYEGDIMIQARIYPQGCDGGRDLYKDFREIEEKVIANCIGRPNLWKYIKGTQENSKWCETACDAHNYEDYFCYSDTGTCILKGKDGEYNGNTDSLMTIGHRGIDLNTGYYIDGDEEYQGILTEMDCLRCANCGEPIDEDDAIWCDGEAYCRDCVHWCDYHEEYEPNDEYDYVNIRGYGDICSRGIEDAIDNGDLYRCEYCGEVYNPNYDGCGYITDDGDCYCCIECAEAAGYVWSDYNDELIWKEDAIRINGEWCRKDDYIECPNCGQMIEARDFVIDLDGDHVCPECYNGEVNEADNEAFA